MGEKTRVAVHYWTPGECPVSSETKEVVIGEIVPLCGMKGEVIEWESFN